MGKEAVAERAAGFACPMDGFRSPQPGQCPRCGMNLVPERTLVPGRFIDDPGAMMLEHPNMVPWCEGTAMAIGAWLLTSPTVIEYQSRSLVISDLASGAAAVAISLYALLRPRRGWIAYLNAAVGIWLLAAPLLFWAPTASVYLNDTAAGTLLIGVSMIIPMTLSMPGPDVPPGWSYNPSRWAQRVPIIALGFIGFFCARAMAAFQLGHVDRVWEPFFGDGTVKVLTSDVSKAWPVSDAGLGAMTYLLEILSTAMGDEKRWRTMPWMVALFGIMVVPLGATSIILVMLQPIAVGAWCTLCLIGAAAMLVMVAPSLDEVVASIQFLNKSRKAGKPLWRTFWHGGNLPDAEESEPPAVRRILWEPETLTLTWQLSVSALAGVWLMIAPALFGGSRLAQASDILLGASITTIAMVAAAEVARAARFVNAALGLWLMASPVLLDGATLAGRINDAAVGVLVLALSLPAGKIKYSYGSYDRFVRWP